MTNQSTILRQATEVLLSKAPLYHFQFSLGLPDNTQFAQTLLALPLNQLRLTKETLKTSCPFVGTENASNSAMPRS